MMRPEINALQDNANLIVPLTVHWVLFLHGHHTPWRPRTEVMQQKKKKKKKRVQFFAPPSRELRFVFQLLVRVLTWTVDASSTPHTSRT